MRIVKSPDPTVGGTLWWLSWALSFAVIAGVLVTVQQYIAGQLMANLRQLRSANAAKDDLLGMVSHELRTPLTPALLILSGLERASDIPLVHREHLSQARAQIELEARSEQDLGRVTHVGNAWVAERDMTPCGGTCYDVLTCTNRLFKPS